MYWTQAERQRSRAQTYIRLYYVRIGGNFSSAVIFKVGDKKSENENKRIVSNKVIMERVFVGKGNAWSHCRAFREVEGGGSELIKK